MNIRFEHITAKNFLSFRNLSLDLTQFEKQTVLVSGKNEDISPLIDDKSASNGSGKSTLMNVILFSIYGSTLNELKNKSIRNWGAGPKDDVEVTLRVTSNGKTYVIQRILKGKSCAGELHVFRQNEDADGKRWVEVTLSTMDETQRMIETEIVPCGKEGFLRCVILTADQNYNFFKLNKAAKNSFFESLFELTTYTRMYQSLHRMCLDETQSLMAFSKTIDSLNENIAKLERERDEAQKNQSDIVQLEEELASAKKELADFEAERDIEAELARIRSTFEKKMEDETVRIESELSDVEKTFSEQTVPEFENQHPNAKVVGGKTVEIDESAIRSESERKISEYDREHGISVGEDGKIIFEKSDEYDALVTRGKEIKERIAHGKTLISELEAEQRKLASDRTKAESAIALKRSKIEQMKNTLSAHSKITDLLCADCLGKYKKSVSIQDYDDRISAIEAEILADGDSFGRIDESISESKAKMKKYEDAMEKLNSTLFELREKVSEFVGSRKTAQSSRDLFVSKVKSEENLERSQISGDWGNVYSNFSAKCEKLRTELESFKTRNGSEMNRLLNDEKYKYDSRRSELSKNVKQCEYKLNLLKESKVKSFDAPIRALNESLDDVKAKFDDSNEKVSHYKALEEILKPDNIRKSAIPEMLKELNFRISGYLAKMGSNYTCEFDEDFEPTFIPKSGKEAEYNNFSSGEKMRLGIACCLAFKDFMQVRLNIHTNTLIIDEYIDTNLDATAVNGIMDLIYYMVGTEKIAAYIISHRSEIKQMPFDSDIFVRKKDNATKVFVNGQEISQLEKCA